MSERYLLLFHAYLRFSKESIPWLLYRLPTNVTGGISFFSCVLLVTSTPVPRFFMRGPVFVLLKIMYFRHSTSYFFKVR